MLTENTDSQPKKLSRTPPTTGPTPKPVPSIFCEIAEMKHYEVRGSGAAG